MNQDAKNTITQDSQPASAPGMRLTFAQNIWGGEEDTNIYTVQLIFLKEIISETNSAGRDSIKCASLYPVRA